MIYIRPTYPHLAMVTKIWIALIAVIVAAGAVVAYPFLLPGPIEESNPFRIKVGIGWFEGSPSGAIYYVAQDRGYFEEQGLEVEIFGNPPGSPGAAQLVGTGLLDFAGDGQGEVIAAITNGLPVIAIGTLFQVSPYAIYSLANNCVSEPEDLVGKKLGLITGGEGELFLPGMLKRVLGEEKFNQIEMVSVGFSPEPLLAGQIDAHSAFAPSAPLDLQLAGQEICIFLAKDYGVKFGGNVILTRTSMVEDHPEVVEAFMKAVSRAAIDVADPAQADQVVDIIEKFRTPEYASREFVAAALPVYNEFMIIPTPDRSGLLWNNPESWEEAQELMIEGERISREVPQNTLYENEFLVAIHSSDGSLIWP